MKPESLTDTKTEELYYRVQGMVCYSCVSIIESIAKKNPGVSDASVNFLSELLKLSVSDSFSEEELLNNAANRGYKLTRTDGKRPLLMEKDDLKSDRNRILISFLLSVAIWTCVILHLSPFIQLIIATVIQVISGGQFYRDAYRAVQSKSPNMSLLVAIGSISTYLFSTYSVFFHVGDTFFEATGTVLMFLLIGKYLERSAKISSSKSIESLMDNFQRTAERINNDQLETIPVSQILPGDHIVVPGNCIIPIDGTIIDGTTETDESTLTGESRPVKKYVGDHVLCGTVNNNHRITVSADCAHEDCVYSRMISAMLRGMDGKRMRIQRITDKISSLFIPAVLSIALLTLLVWYAWLLPGDIYKAISAMVSVLVAACPCALGIAVPLAITEAIGVLGKSGIIIKNPAALETMSCVKIIAFDKTGTLTIGTDDTIREGAPITIKTLGDIGIKPIILSGDDKERVELIANKCEVNTYYSNLKPEDKCQIINDCKTDATVAMIGDGVNDLLTLVNADVGIAIGYAAEMNLECADVVLSQNKIAHLLKVIYVSRVMMKNAKQSLSWVAIYNLIAISLAVAGILTPVFSGIAMSVSSMIIVINANRLKKKCETITFDRIRATKQ